MRRPFALHNCYPAVLKSRKACCQWAGKTYRPERASCPRWPESSSMTPLRFYWICPLTVSRDNKNQRKSKSALTRSYLWSSKNLQTLPSYRKIRSIYPVSPKQFYSLNKNVSGSQAVKKYRLVDWDDESIYVPNSLHQSIRLMWRFRNKLWPSNIY